jgi:hypothetical protein
VNENPGHQVPNRLEEHELVRHREPCWEIGDLEAIDDTTADQPPDMSELPPRPARHGVADTRLR